MTQEIKCKFNELIDRTDNVKSFRFVLENEFDYLPGQFVQVIFDEENRGNKDLNKVLSLSCCPGMGYIEVTKKISESEFSKRLMGLQNEDEVLFKGPMGSMTISKLDNKCCFLVGGIGITPVIPILEYVVDQKVNKDIILIYSNWSEQDIAFKKEIDELVEKNDNLSRLHVLNETDGSYIKGFITKEVIADHVKDYKERDFLIFGPPKMVEVMKNICSQMQCKKERIKAETFLGY